MTFSASHWTTLGQQELSSHEEDLSGLLNGLNVAHHRHSTSHPNVVGCLTAGGEP